MQLLDLVKPGHIPAVDEKLRERQMLLLEGLLELRQKPWDHVQVTLVDLHAKPNKSNLTRKRWNRTRREQIGAKREEGDELRAAVTRTNNSSRRRDEIEPNRSNPTRSKMESNSVAEDRSKIRPQHIKQQEGGMAGESWRGGDENWDGSLSPQYKKEERIKTYLHCLVSCSLSWAEERSYSLPPTQTELEEEVLFL